MKSSHCNGDPFTANTNALIF
uniref:Uncharacterized protein n=1 Tax=Arundo donax TaxID=35708 RepID=A0A0A9ADX4_ARUDO